MTCLPHNFEYGGRILKLNAGNGPIYIRLTASLLKQPRVTWSSSSGDSDFELPDASSIYNKRPTKVIIDISDEDSDFELPSIAAGTTMPALSQSTITSSANNTLPALSIPVSTDTPTTSGGCHTYQSSSLCRSTSTQQPINTSQSTSSANNTLPVPTETPSTSGARNRTHRSLSLRRSTSAQQPINTSQSTSSADNTLPAPVPTETPINFRS